MHDSKLITFLKALDDDEIKRFGKFLEGTAQRKSPDRIIFFNYLKKHHPEFPEKKMEREHIAQKLFAKDKNNLKKIENFIHSISLVLEDFLSYEELKVQKTKRDFLLLEAFKRRQLDKFFFKKIEQINRIWENDTSVGIEQLHNEYLTKKMCLEHPNYSIISQTSITQDDLIHQIDKYYFAVKLYRTLCSYTTQKFLITSDNDTTRKQHFIQQILALCQQVDFQNNSHIKLLSNLYQTYTTTTSNFDNYNDIKQEFMSSLGLYNEYEKIDILLLLTNICYAMHRQGISEAINKLFELNQVAVEHKLIFENGYISDINFRNIVNIACAASKLDWAEEFVSNYGGFLHPDLSDDILILCKSIIDFNRGDYNEALSKLAIVKFQDVIYNAQARTTMLQCYYELDHELFFSSADSFKSFLGRNTTLSISAKKAFSNFIRFAKKLKKAEHEFRPDVKRLVVDIADTNEVVNKNWLISKVDLLRHND